MTQIKPVNAFVTTDGQLHRTALEAERAQRRINMRFALNKVFQLDVSNSNTFSYEDVMSFLCDNYAEIMMAGSVSFVERET